MAVRNKGSFLLTWIKTDWVLASKRLIVLLILTNALYHAYIDIIVIIRVRSTCLMSNADVGCMRMCGCIDMESESQAVRL